MQVRLCGVRGRAHVVGDDRRLVGRATSCVVVADDAGVPLVVLDGGTGYRTAIGPLGVPSSVPVLLSHLHHGHVDGIASARPPDGDRLDVRFAIDPAASTAARDDDAVASAALESAAGEPLPHVRASALLPGDLSIGPLEIRVRSVPHGDEPTVGFRVSDRRGSIAYLPDHSPQDLDPGPHGWGAYHHDVVDLSYGVDLLLHGAMFDADTLGDRVDLEGHTTVQYAVGLAERCHVGALVLIHHHPAHTDRDVFTMVDKLGRGSAIPVVAGREGDVLVPHDASVGDSSRPG